MVAVLRPANLDGKSRQQYSETVVGKGGNIPKIHSDELKIRGWNTQLGAAVNDGEVPVEES